jgi:GNAT superfamily N-acetyltransferase
MTTALTDPVSTAIGREKRPGPLAGPSVCPAGANELRIRPLTSADGSALDAVGAAMSAHTRFLRFHAPTPHLTAPLRALLLDLDGRDRAALVAEVPSAGGWRPVGIARLARSGPDQAETAIVVIDDCQHHGVGERLLRALAALAEGLGYRQLLGAVLLENDRVVRLLQRVFPGSTVEWDDDVFVVHSPLGSDHVATMLDHLRPTQ